MTDATDREALGALLEATAGRLRAESDLWTDVTTRSTLRHAARVLTASARQVREGSYDVATGDAMADAGVLTLRRIQQKRCQGRPDTTSTREGRSGRWVRNAL